MPRCLVKGTMATTTTQNLWAGWLQQVLELVPLLVLLRELLQVQILDPVQLAQQLVAQAQRVPHQSCFGSTRSCRRRGLQSTHFLHQPHRIQQTLFEDPWTMMEHYGTSFSLTTCPSDLVQMKVCAPAISQKHISCKSSSQNAVKTRQLWETSSNETTNIPNVQNTIKNTVFHRALCFSFVWLMDISSFSHTPPQAAKLRLSPTLAKMASHSDNSKAPSITAPTNQVFGSASFGSILRHILKRTNDNKSLMNSMNIKPPTKYNGNIRKPVAQETSYARSLCFPVKGHI